MLRKRGTAIEVDRPEDALDKYFKLYRKRQARSQAAGVRRGCKTSSRASVGSSILRTILAPYCTTWAFPIRKPVLGPLTLRKPRVWSGANTQSPQCCDVLANGKPCCSVLLVDVEIVHLNGPTLLINRQHVMRR
jgi:hypothetical protein